MYKSVCFDITGGCNAKCPLCVTGRVSFGQRINYISVADFAKTIDRLVELELIAPGKSVINPYNWGEPIIHPDLDGIVSVLNDRNFAIGFSTNASKRTSFTVSTKNIVDFCFSMPGFSQASYDKIHGFKFPRILRNIEDSIENVRANGYPGVFRIAFHVYQFNAHAELEAARAWCVERGIGFIPFYAYINDYEIMKAYLQGTLDSKSKDDISKKIFLHYHESVIAERTPGFVCNQWDDVLTLDHRSNVLLCCSMPEGHDSYTIGSVFDHSRERIIEWKKTNKECDECIGCGVAQWGKDYEYVPRAYMPGAPNVPMSVDTFEAQLAVARGAVADREADLATERKELVMRREQVVLLNAELEKLRLAVRRDSSADGRGTG